MSSTFDSWRSLGRSLVFALWLCPGWKRGFGVSRIFCSCRETRVLFISFPGIANAIHSIVSAFKSFISVFPRTHSKNTVKQVLQKGNNGSWRHTPPLSTMSRSGTLLRSGHAPFRFSVKRKYTLGLKGPRWLATKVTALWVVDRNRDQNATVYSPREADRCRTWTSFV